MRIAAVVSAFAVIFAIAELWRHWRRPPVEVTRKFVHAAAGAVALTLGWLVDDLITMALLCAGFAAVLGITQARGWLNSIHGVERTSMGGICYPIAVFCTFWIASATGRPEFYTIALLVLAISDSFAALVGKNYGRKTFLVQDEHKSIEGSAFFFITTFTIVHVSLSLLTPLGELECVLCALYVATLVTAVELLCLSGVDNLFIPIAVIAILLKITTKPVDEMLWQLAFLYGDALLVFLFVLPRKNVSASGAIGLSLLTYGVHALVGFAWGFLPLAAIALYGLSGITLPKSTAAYRVRPTFYMTINILLWVLATNYFELAAAVTFTAFAVNVMAIMHLLWEHALRQGWPMKPVLSVPNVGTVGAAALFAAAVAFIHAELDPAAKPLYDGAVLFVADLALVAIGLRTLGGDGPAVRRIQSTALAAAAISAGVLLISWRVYGHLI